MARTLRGSPLGAAGRTCHHRNGGYKQRRKPCELWEQEPERSKRQAAICTVETHRHAKGETGEQNTRWNTHRTAKKRGYSHLPSVWECSPEARPNPESQSQLAAAAQPVLVAFAAQGWQCCWPAAGLNRPAGQAAQVAVPV